MSYSRSLKMVRVLSVIIASMLVGAVIGNRGESGGLEGALPAAAIMSQDRTPELRFDRIDAKLRRSFNILRAKVPGGWLIFAVDEHNDPDPSIAFYPDNNHEWKVKSAN